MGRLPCGLIGAGHFFNYAYLPALNHKNSPLVISGILTRGQNQFELARQGLRYATKYFSDFDELLDSGIKAVLILLPNHLHAEFARKALEKGVHVFCEKPLASDVSGAFALKAIAKKSGRVLMVDFNERYFDRNHVLKKIITEGRIGKIMSVQAFHNQDLRQLSSFASLHRNLTGGGVIHNAGIHFINLFLNWFGRPERVHAVFENRALPAECGEDTARCQFWFPGGLTATLDASLANAADTTYERVQFTSEDGEITSDLKKSDILLRRPPAKRQLHITCKKEIISDSVFNALAAFARCVQTGSKPETDVDDFIETMKVIEALTLSAQRGAEVRLEEIERRYASRNHTL